LKAAPLGSLTEVEREHIAKVLGDHRGNRTAAKTLRTDRKTLWRKLWAYGLRQSDVWGNLPQRCG
jgi:DNA-binding NtrC family response regulator